MPILELAGTSILTTSLTGVGMVGIATPQLANAIASGIASWATTRTVTTVDTGTLGAGKGFLPLAVPSLYPVLTVQAVAAGMSGTFTPVFLAGLSLGISSFLAQGLISTFHPGIGAGTAIATISGPPSTPIFLTSFEMKGLTGQSALRLARVIGLTFDTTIPTYTYIVPIVGSPTPTSGVGVGFGTLA